MACLLETFNGTGTIHKSLASRAHKPVALVFIWDEKYDRQLGKRDLEELFGWKSLLITNVVVGTSNIDQPPSTENYEVIKNIVHQPLEKLHQEFQQRWTRDNDLNTQPKQCKCWRPL